MAVFTVLAADIKALTLRLVGISSAGLTVPCWPNPAVVTEGMLRADGVGSERFFHFSQYNRHHAPRRPYL